MNKRDALDLVTQTHGLYSAILRARANTSSIVLKDLGDAIYDAVPWEDIGAPVKVALMQITKELVNANTQATIEEVAGQTLPARPVKEEKEDDQEDIGEDDQEDDQEEETVITEQPEGYTPVTSEEKAALNKAFGQFAKDETRQEAEEATEENTRPATS